MITIFCHNDNRPERTYAIDALLHTLLEFSKDNYKIVFDDNLDSYVIEVEKGRIMVEDHFFRYFPAPLSYLDKQNVPNGLHFLHAYDKEIPIIYGIDKMEQNGTTTTIGVDIFASTFFMLTRWEEFLFGREEKGDCDEALLFMVKHNAYTRPIVHEYEDLMRKILQSYGLNLKSERKYNAVLSHDVDGFLTPSWTNIAKSFVWQAIHGVPKNKVLNLTWKEKIKYKLAFSNAFVQFDMFMALAEKLNIKEWFYLKVCEKGEKEATYRFSDKITEDVVERLKKRNNPNLVLGFHPSQNVFGKERQWTKEVSRIKELLHETPSIGRNHHLLYNNQMLRLWETLSNPSLHISNCVFHKRQGFRSGICVPYPLFDVYQRREMMLMEHPCQIMDTVIRYDEIIKSEEQRWLDVKTVIDNAKQYQGELVVTWHIYIRNKDLINTYYKWCERVMNYAVKG